MKNIKGDLIWGSIILVWVFVLLIPTSREMFVEVTEAYPYIGGFVKFAILASMGDLLGGRILKGEWIFADGFLYKAIVWGVMGILITLVFSVYYNGVVGAQNSGDLPFAGSKIMTPIFVSVIMNATFGPMLYIYHKFGDLFVDLSLEKKRGQLPGGITIEEMVKRVDWYSMVSFSWLKTCIFVWMPCHSFVFLLPEQYRVLASAFLSILLGILVALSKKTKV